MKVVVLGGAGDMGKRAVRALVQYPEVSRITVADLNLAGAERLATALGGPPRLQAVQVDAMNPRSLQDVLSGHQVAASAVGPFYKFEVRVAQAAIEAGVDLVTLCDDHDAALAVLELDASARAAGRRIITGLGWTPGMSNVLASRGAAALDRVRGVDVAWAGASADSKGFAVVLHTLHIFTGRVPSYHGGCPVSVAAGTGRRKVTFPTPLGEVTCSHVGHPEPVTLPRYLPGVETVTLRGGLTEPFLNWLAVAVARAGLTNTPGKKDFLGRLVKRALPLLERVGPKGVACSGLRVDVMGEKDGERHRISYLAADHMENLTGVPLAIGAVLLGRQEVSRTGVMAPEAPGAIDPEAFVGELGRHGIKVIEERSPWVEVA